MVWRRIALAGQDAWVWRSKVLNAHLPVGQFLELPPEFSLSPMQQRLLWNMVKEEWGLAMSILHSGLRHNHAPRANENLSTSFHQDKFLLKHLVCCQKVHFGHATQEILFDTDDNKLHLCKVTHKSDKVLHFEHCLLNLVTSATNFSS